MSQNILQVNQLLLLAKHTIDQNLQLHHVFVVGELSNFTAHRSGHWYFSLKDSEGKLNAVMFSRNNRTVNFRPKDGDKVILQGSLSIFPANGQLQFMANSMSLEGIGKYFIEFERRKKLLLDAGYLDETHKKKIPRYPFSIGLIVGEGSAAQADVRKVLHQRWPVAKIIEYPSLVQGEMAPQALIKQCLAADDNHHDVVIIARGGGSIEDLWAFNSLELAQVIFRMTTPIISGVGHEIDTTLVDYVSDLRALTPTAAAQSATPNLEDVQQDIFNFRNKIKRELQLQVRHKRVELLQIKERKIYKQPSVLFETYRVQLDYLDNQLIQFAKQVSRLRIILKEVNLRFSVRVNGILNRYDQLRIKQSQTSLSLMRQHYQKYENKLKSNIVMLDLLSPLKIMGRGYALTYKDDQIIKNIDDVNVDDNVTIRYKNGKIDTRVMKKESINE